MPMVRTKRSGLRERLVTYFMGVAIGCMIVGLLLMLRQAMLRPPPTQPPAPPPPGANP